MRQFLDESGRQWTVAEVLFHGIGDRPVQANIATIHFEHNGDIVRAEAPRGLLGRLSEEELRIALEWARARRDVEAAGHRMRFVTDQGGTEWLVSEEGLPGPRSGVPGGLALRFISPQGKRYLAPLPGFWWHEADESLLEYLDRAQPPTRG